MGGPGSGRTIGTEKRVNNLLGFNQPADTDNAQIYLPNYSGLQAVKKTDAPIGGAVDSVFGRTGTVVAAEDDYDIGQMGDVTITAAAVGDILRHDGAVWVDYPDSNYAASSHTHALAAGATDVTSTAAEVNILDGATLTVTELNYVDGVTSAIQTQLDAKGAGDFLADGTVAMTGDLNL